GGGGDSRHRHRRGGSVRRRPEAARIGLNPWALGTWITPAAGSLRRPRATAACPGLAAPLTTAFAMTLLSGRWAG
ncbi:hypothetical protein ABT317_43210, partial [Streptomyces carpinensis]